MTDTTSAARDVLQANRRGGYTIPSPKLYPYQWNWDSGFIAIGLSAVAADAAKTELRRLFAGTHEDGLLPHILFHDKDAAGYFPGPDEWNARTSNDLATSAITQPPVAVTAARTVYERTQDEAFLATVLPAIRTHLTWWIENRSFDGAVVYVRHPWETGMDDSPAWDAPLAAIDPGSPEYQREDLKTEEADRERPPDWYYDRYVYLLRQGRRLEWNESALRTACPFLVEDVLTNALFVRACEDLAAMLETVGEPEAAARWRDQAATSRERARSRLWNEELGTFVSYDRVNDRQLRANSVAGLATTFAGIPTDEQFDQLETTLTEEFFAYSYGVPTYVGDAFDPDRYWRGPVWVNTNWLVARGLRRYDADAAERIKASTCELIESNGFYEYFNPKTGAGRGSDAFSWTAALYLDWMTDDPLPDPQS